jgi:GNAT superfamily N-acetyltransferase
MTDIATHHDFTCTQATTDKDAETVFNIIQQCGLDMLERYKLSHWVPSYPLSSIKQDILEERVYIVWSQHNEQLTPIGTFAIFRKTPLYLDGFPHWRDSNAQCVYLKKLAVIPSSHGSGIGTWCLNKMEQIVCDTEKDCSYIRLDCTDAVPNLVNFYEKRGYESRALWIYTDGTTEIRCMEKYIRQ